MVVSRGTLLLRGNLQGLVYFNKQSLISHIELIHFSFPVTLGRQVLQLHSVSTETIILFADCLV